MPQNPNILATQTTDGDTYIFDRTKHASEPDADGVCKPDIKLKGHSKEGCVSLDFAHTHTHKNKRTKSFDRVTRRGPKGRRD